MTLGDRTNAIYRELVEEALGLEIESIRFAGEPFGDRDLANVFGGDDAVVNELVRLRDWNASANHYVLGAYHNALLFSVLPDQLEFLNEAAVDDGPMDFCDGRYVVREIDIDACVETLLGDFDFVLPKDRVNELDPAEKFLLGLDDAVFGVANGLPPHPDELHPRRGSADAVVEIVEITVAAEDALRRRHSAAPDAVWEEVAAMGPLYRRGERFPYWPAWLDGGEAGSEADC